MIGFPGAKLQHKMGGCPLSYKFDFRRRKSRWGERGREHIGGAPGWGYGYELHRVDFVVGIIEEGIFLINWVGDPNVSWSDLYDMEYAQVLYVRQYFDEPQKAESHH